MTSWLRSLCLVALCGCGTFMGNPSARKDTTKPPKRPVDATTLADLAISSVLAPRGVGLVATPAARDDSYEACTVKGKARRVRSQLRSNKSLLCVIEKLMVPIGQKTTFKVKGGGGPDDAFTVYSTKDGASSKIYLCHAGKMNLYIASNDDERGRKTGTYLSTSDAATASGTSGSDGASDMHNYVGTLKSYFTFDVGSATDATYRYVEGVNFTNVAGAHLYEEINLGIAGTAGSLEARYQYRYPDQTTAVASGFEAIVSKFDDRFGEAAYVYDGQKGRGAFDAGGGSVAETADASLKAGGALYVEDAAVPAKVKNGDVAAEMPVSDWDCAGDVVVEVGAADKSIQPCEDDDEDDGSFACQLPTDTESGADEQATSMP